MSAAEALARYSKRDCVEKVFQALKSSLEMNKYGADGDDSIHGKSLIWFAVPVLHAVMFSKTFSLRVANKKDYTLPAVIDQLDMIPADKDLSGGKYIRRYAPTKKQAAVLNASGMTYEDIDRVIEDVI